MPKSSLAIPHSMAESAFVSEMKMLIQVLPALPALDQSARPQNLNAVGDYFASEAAERDEAGH